MLPEFNRKLIFPSKSVMKPVIKAPKTALISNHFPVAFTNPNFKAYEWTFSFILQADLAAYRAAPDADLPSAIAADNRAEIDRVMNSARRDLLAKFGPNFTAGNVLYSFKHISANEVVLTPSGRYAIILRSTKNVLSPSDLIPCADSRHKFLQMLNSQVKHIFKSQGFLELGYNRRYYDQRLTEEFEFNSAKFQILKGFSAVFECYESGLKLQLDYATRVISSETLWARIQRETRAGGKLETICTNVAEGRSFMTVYGNQRLVRVDGWDFGRTPMSAFPNPEYKSFADYYRRQYSLTIKDTKQPLAFQTVKQKYVDEEGELKTRVEKIFFVPELLKAEGIPDDLRKNGIFMRELATRGILAPDARFKKTAEIISSINQNTNKAIEFNVSATQNKVTGHVYEPPKLAQESTAGVNLKGDRINVNKLVEHTDLTNWCVFYDRHSDKPLDNVIDILKEVADNLKFKIEDPTQGYMVDDKTDLKKLVKDLSSAKNPPQMVLAFVSRQTSKNLYKEIKRLCHQAGLLTQFFTNYNPSRDTEPSPKFKNLVLQMQAKLGNNLWSIDTQLADTLVLGADVYHSKNGRSVASLVGQFGKNLKRTFTETSMQSGRYEEIIASMSTMFLSILEHYQKVEKKLPGKVLFYRDGVGQSFIERTLQAEVGSLIKAMETKYTLKRPKITVVLVTKRISDKFASSDPRPMNPAAGTVVESGVTELDRATFFMIAQKVTQGTANPTKYQVVYDENETRFEDLIKLTHSLCWSYFNWMGPVKVPSPVQYAHKSCYLIGELQDAKVSQNIKSSKYYL